MDRAISLDRQPLVLLRLESLFVGAVAVLGFDRLLGYGLKGTEGLGFTHLWRIGKNQ